MSRAFGGRLVTSLSLMRIAPRSTSSSPASMRRLVDLPQPDGPTRTRNSPSPISRWSESTAGRVLPGKIRLALSKVTVAMGTPLLDGAERQTLHQLVLGGESGDEYRQRHDDRRRAPLPQEQALAGDEPGQVDGRRLGDGAGEHAGEQQFVPAEDEADQRGGGDTGHDDRPDDRPQRRGQGRAVHLGRL